MKKNLKLLGVTLGLSLLGIAGLLFNGSKAEAAAYDSNYENFTPNPEANAEAIEILRKDGDLESSPFPIESLTIEQPIESTIELPLARAALQKYRASALKEVYRGSYQWRVNELAPVGFNWIDNGIPTSITNGFGNGFTFNSSKVSDTRVGTWQYGYYWRKFNTSEGAFWASVWDKNDLLY